MKIAVAYDNGMVFQHFRTGLYFVRHRSMAVRQTKAPPASHEQQKNKGGVGMQLFPFFQDITDKKFVVIGSGNVASEKIERLKMFTDNIEIVSGPKPGPQPDPQPDLQPDLLPGPRSQPFRYPLQIRA